MYDKFAIFRKLYGIDLDDSYISVKEITYNSCKLYDEIKGKRVAVVLIPCGNINNISIKLKLKNIVAFYDYELKDFYSFEDNNCIEHEYS